MRNRWLIIQPTVERFLFYIGEGSYKKTGKMRNRWLITTLALLHIFILHRRGWFSELELANSPLSMDYDYMNSPFNMDFHLCLYGEQK